MCVLLLNINPPFPGTVFVFDGSQKHLTEQTKRAKQNNHPKHIPSPFPKHSCALQWRYQCRGFPSGESTHRASFPIVGKPNFNWKHEIGCCFVSLKILCEHFAASLMYSGTGQNTGWVPKCSTCLIFRKRFYVSLQLTRNPMNNEQSRRYQGTRLTSVTIFSVFIYLFLLPWIYIGVSTMDTKGNLSRSEQTNSIFCVNSFAQFGTNAYLIFVCCVDGHNELLITEESPTLLWPATARHSARSDVALVL